MWSSLPLKMLLAFGNIFSSGAKVGVLPSQFNAG
jgi:hypothetical protein